MTFLIFVEKNAELEQELQEAVHEFVYDIDGMEIKVMRITTE